MAHYLRLEMLEVQFNSVDEIEIEIDNADCVMLFVINTLLGAIIFRCTFSADSSSLNLFKKYFVFFFFLFLGKNFSFDYVELLSLCECSVPVENCSFRCSLKFSSFFYFSSLKQRIKFFKQIVKWFFFMRTYYFVGVTCWFCWLCRQQFLVGFW